MHAERNPHEPTSPRVLHLLQGDALDLRDAPTGRVGTVFRGAGIEAVWVAKQGEVIDTEWFSQPTIDLILVVQGQLRVEFAREDLTSLVLDPGDVLVLPPGTRCRAYRWPREREEATVFLAVYPISAGGDHAAGGAHTAE